MDAPICFRELEQLAGEMLPERTLLSTMPDVLGLGDAIVGGGDRGYPHPMPQPMPYPVDHTDDGATVYYACQTTYSPGNPGLLGSGLVGSDPYYSQTCTPAAVAAT